MAASSVREVDAAPLDRRRSASLLRTVASWLRRSWVPVTLVVVGLASSTTVTLLHSDALSPLDEWVYSDYLYKIPAQPIVRGGEPIGHEALDAIACDGVTPYGVMGDPCGSDYDYHDFPFGGISSADPYTPVYFYLTDTVGQGISIVTGVDELTGWRLTGPLWLAGGLVMFSALLRRWGVRPTAVLALGFAVIGSPLAYWTYTYVSTDVPAFLCGAALLYLATRLIRRDLAWGWFVGVAVVTGLFKITNLLGVGMAVLFLVVHGIATIVRRGPPREGRRLILVGVGSLVLSSAAQAAWLVFDRLTPLSTQSAVQNVGTPLTPEELLSQLVSFLPGTLSFNVPIAGGGGFAFPLPGFAATPLGWICIAGVVGCLLLMRGEWTRRSSVIVTVAAASLLAAPTLALTLQIVTHSYFSLPARYGASLLPGFLLLAGMILRNRWVPWVIVAYATALVVAQVYVAYLLGRG